MLRGIGADELLRLEVVLHGRPVETIFLESEFGEIRELGVGTLAGVEVDGLRQGRAAVEPPDGSRARVADRASEAARAPEVDARRLPNRDLERAVGRRL